MSILETLKFKMPVHPVTLTGATTPVYVRQMTAAQAEEHAKEVEGMTDASKVYTRLASLVARCLCDADGNLLCQQDGVNQVLQLGTDAVVSLYEACAAVNGFRPGAVDDAAKN